MHWNGPLLFGIAIQTWEHLLPIFLIYSRKFCNTLQGLRTSQFNCYKFAKVLILQQNMQLRSVTTLWFTDHRNLEYFTLLGSRFSWILLPRDPEEPYHSSKMPSGGPLCSRTCRTMWKPVTQVFNPNPVISSLRTPPSTPHITAAQVSHIGWFCHSFSQLQWIYH